MTEPVTSRLAVPGSDLEVTVSLEKGELTMVLTKANSRVYRVVVEQATTPIENAWLCDMFMHDHRVRLGQLNSDVEEYVESLKGKISTPLRPNLRLALRSLSLLFFQEKDQLDPTSRQRFVGDVLVEAALRG
jgi:hypothetical protein